MTEEPSIERRTPGLIPLIEGKLSRTFFNKEGGFDPDRLCQVLLKLKHIITLRDNEEVLVYKESEGFYSSGGETVLREIMKMILGEDYRERYATEVINHVTASTYRKREEFELPLNLLPVKNGVLDFKNSHELLEHDPHRLVLSVLPVKYDSMVSCPRFMKFIEEIQPDEIQRNVLQEMFGYCLLRDYPFHAIFMLVGEGGNGRSTLLAVLRSLLGKRNVSTESLQGLSNNRFSTADLYGKYANICPDMPTSPIENTSILKSATGGDLIRAERKLQQPFNFINYAKFIFSTNKVPLTEDESYAYYRRMILLFFDVTFGTEERPAVPNMVDELTTPEELSGILNWALEGLSRVVKNKCFSYAKTPEETRSYYKDFINPARSFMEAEVDVTNISDDYIPKEEFWSKLETFCKDKKVPMPSTHHLMNTMKKIIPWLSAYDDRKTIGDKQVHCWMGIKWKTAAAEEKNIIKGKERSLDAF